MSRAVRVDTRNVGQEFGVVGVIRDAKTGRKLLETVVKPHGAEASARQTAETLAAEKGWTISSDDE